MHFVLCRQPNTMETNHVPQALQALDVGRSTVLSRWSKRTKKFTDEGLGVTMRQGAVGFEPARNTVISSGDGVISLRFSRKAAGSKARLTSFVRETKRVMWCTWDRGRKVATFPLICTEPGGRHRGVRAQGAAPDEVELHVEGEISWDDAMAGKPREDALVHCTTFTPAEPVALAKTGIVYFLTAGKTKSRLVSVTGLTADGERVDFFEAQKRPTVVPRLGVFTAGAAAGKPIVRFEILTDRPTPEMRLGVTDSAC